MKNNKKSFLHESIQDAKSIEKILAAMSDSLAKGTLNFSDEDDTIEFHPRGMMQLKLSAMQDGNQQRFSIKVRWQIENGAQKDKKLKVK